MSEMLFYVPGDLVMLKHDILNKPEMVVKTVSKSKFKNEEGKTTLIGIVCYWFTKNLEYQEQIFNTKDLVKVNVP